VPFPAHLAPVPNSPVHARNNGCMESRPRCGAVAVVQTRMSALYSFWNPVAETLPMQPLKSRRSVQAILTGRSLHTSRRDLGAGLLGLAALVSVSSAATVTLPPALDMLQIQRLAYPEGAVPPEALAAMKSRLAAAKPLPAESTPTDALAGSPSVPVTTGAVADGMATESVEASGAAAVSETSPEADVAATAERKRVVPAPSTGQPAGSAPMRSPAMSVNQVRELAKVYFRAETQSAVEVGGSPTAAMAPGSEPIGAVAATAERKAAGPVAEVPSATGVEQRPQVAMVESPQRHANQAMTMRPDAIRELAGIYDGHATAQTPASPPSPVVQVERPADGGAEPGVSPAPAGQTSVSAPIQQATTAGSASAAVNSQRPVGQPAPRSPQVISLPVLADDEVKADAPQPASALRKPGESNGDGNAGQRPLPQAQLDVLIDVFAPELQN